MVVELFCSTFYFLKNTFDKVAFAEGFISEVNAEFEEARLQPRRSVDEKLGVPDIMFLVEFAEEHFGHGGISRRIEPNVEDLVRFGVHGCIQPESFTFDLDDGLIESDFVRRSSGLWLEAGFLNPGCESWILRV